MFCRSAPRLYIRPPRASLSKADPFRTAAFVQSPTGALSRPDIFLLSASHFRGRIVAQEDWGTANIDINETMARRFWPEGDAIGKRIDLCAFGPKRCWAPIVGIVANVHEFGLDAAPTYDVYFCGGWTDYLRV